MPKTVYLTDGSADFVSGVDSGKVALVASSSNPNGLRRDQLSWAMNVSVRGGPISPRTGWKYLTTLSDGQTPWQGGIMYEPSGFFPRLFYAIGGQIFECITSVGATPVNLSAGGLSMSPTIDQFYFCQAEDYVLVQDTVNRPLIFNNAIMFRSNGILGPGNPANQIPVASSMDYFMQRLWYVQGYRTVSAGDIIGGSSGSAPNHTDSILYVTENPLAVSGDGFSIPTSAGPIRALHHSAAIDVALGQGQLIVFTRKQIYNIDVPVTRADWTTTTEPLQKVIQNKYGTPAERSVVSANGDLFYVTMEPGVRTLALAVRYFNQWANTPISRNMNRLNQFQDRALLRFASGMLFDNRLYETALPYAAGPVGVAHSALQVLDFDLISSFQDRLQSPPIPSWEGIHEGLNVLQIFSGDFGGNERGFAVVMSSLDGSIQLWELTSGDKFENGDGRITMQFETAAFDFNSIFQLKRLQGGKLWMDRIYGKIDVIVEYRSDDSACWAFWSNFNKCYARTSEEDVKNPVSYPLTPYGEGSEKPLSLPQPNLKECAPNSVRPMAIGYSFQLRITVIGYARVRGFLLFATPFEESIYMNQVC